MKPLKLLTCLILSIAITGIASVDTSLALLKNPPKPQDDNKQALSTVDESKKVQNSIQELEKQVKESNNKIKSLDTKNMIDVNSFWIIPLLFTLNFLATAGVLIYLMYRTKKTSETAERRNISINGKLDKKLDRPDRDPFSTKTDLNKIDKEIKNRIRELAEKQQILDVSISNIRREIKDSLATLALTSRDSNSINQNFATDLNNLQPHILLSDYYPSENTEPAYLTDYNNRQKNFADTYRSLVVEREPENYNLSRAGQTEEVILTEEIRGNYWLFSHDGLIYVVPSQKLKIREDKLNEVKDLFDCENYQESNYDNYTLIKPALVSQKVNGNWRLKEKGKLQFG